MWFEQMIRRESGCASYMIGSTKTGECVVFDPLWDVAPYLEMAKRMDARIRYIIDSHTHADHVSGARRLAYSTGGELIMPRLARLSYPATRVDDGDTLRLGDVLLEMVHTPGHRPEMMSMLVTDLTRSERPWCILTGDFVLVGDLGRPDLAQQGDEGARMLFEQALPRFQALEDYVEIYPGHVAGSVCSRVTSGKSVSTAGFERRFNWLLQMRDRAMFVAEMNAGQLAPPANAASIMAINQGRQPLTMELPCAPHLAVDELIDRVQTGHLLIDTRNPDSFAAGHIAGAYNVSLESARFEQWVGWVAPADTPLLLLVESPVDVEVALKKLAFLGLDRRVTGYVCSDVMSVAGRSGEKLVRRSLPRLAVHDLYERLRDNGKEVGQASLHVLDVRTCTEWQSGHIAGAQQWTLQELGDRIDELPLADGAHVAVVCASGVRSSIASSILMHHGYRHVYSVTGGMAAWHAANLPTLECSEDGACPLWRQGEKQGAARAMIATTPVAVEALGRQDFSLPYWMEMGALACTN